MSKIYDDVKDRISKVGENISEKIKTGDNIKHCLEELDFLSTLLGNIFTESEDLHLPSIMSVGDILDSLVTYNENIPVYVYNNLAGNNESYRFSRLSSFDYNKERGTIELYYSTQDEDSYEDY